MSNTNKLISVIIPAKNRAEFTSEAIDSVLIQKLPFGYKLEVLVVDNRSKPSLESMIGKNFPKARFIENNGFDSPGGSRNVGLKFAKGDYIAFLDNDDKWKQNFLLTSIDVLEKSKSSATVCLTNPYFFADFPFKHKAKIIFLNIVRTVTLLFFWVFNDKKLPQSGFYLCQISHILFNKQYIKDFKFNEIAVAAEDWEFNVNATQNKPFIIIPKPLVNFRYEVKSNTFNPKVREGKEKAYYNLLSIIPKTHKQGLLNLLFKLYIKNLLVK